MSSASASTAWFGPRLPYLVISLLVIGVDFASKAAVLAWLAPRGSVPVISGLFDLTYVRNPGGVFGMFRDIDPGLRSALFTVVPVAAIVLIAAYARRIPPAHRAAQVALALILGGAAGNLVDRIRFGYVIDFLDVYWRDHHWPAFNVADSAICVGVGLLMLETVTAPHHRDHDPRSAHIGAAGDAEATPGDLP